MHIFLANPYYGEDFFGVIILFIQRFVSFCIGKDMQLAADELQFLTLSLIGISAAIVGSWLVLRKLAMLANSLSHTTLLGIVLVYLFHRWLQGGVFEGTLSVGSLIVASLTSGLLTAFMTDFLTHKMRLQEDASNGIVFTFLFALGIALVTILTRSAHVGTELVMGNVDMLHTQDLQSALWVCGLNVLLVVVFFRGFFVTTFDGSFASVEGINKYFFQYLLLFQVSLTSVSAFRAVGVLMVLAFIVGLPLIARLWTHHLPKMLLISSVCGIFASLIGVALSRHIYSAFHTPLSTGGVVVCMILLLYLLSLLFSPKSLIWKRRLRKGLKSS